MSKLLGMSVIRLGEHGENKRVWITNKKLGETFYPGEKVHVHYEAQNNLIKISKNILGGNTISKRGNGTPVIDIKNRQVEKTLGIDVEKVEVLFFENEIVIKVSKTELYKKQRANKKGLNTFEMFCGGGTLSSIFKESGFNIVGGLEMNPEYLAMFSENNRGDEVYTISSRLEDVHSSYYPRNVSVLLSGIPCTNYSLGNLKMNKNKKLQREGADFDQDTIDAFHHSESLILHLAIAIKAMNPRVCVFEEVTGFANPDNAGYSMLKAILKDMGYFLSENIATGKHTKRTRWCMIASMNEAVPFTETEDDGKTIADILQTSTEDREWKHIDEFPKSRLNPKIGIRSVLPTDTKTNTFTSHSTRGTEPIYKKSANADLYSEFTNEEIKLIHGLPQNYILDNRKSIARQILGQGVTDQFFNVALSIKDMLNKNTEPNFSAA